jgi:hypothetical protein
MNSVENLKSAQWRHLFRIFKFSSMQSFNIFVARKGFLFEFANLSGVRKFENYLTGPGPHVSDPFLFDRLGWSPGPTCCPYSRWPCSPRGECMVPVAAGRRRPTWVGPPLSLLWTSPRKPPPTLLFPSHHSVALLAALLRTGHRFARCRPLPMSRPRAVRPGQKECLITMPLLHQEPAHSAG